jgi:copper chaperone CopZ
MREVVFMAEVVLDVPEIACQGCANAIQRAVGGVWGVCDVSVDVPAKKVTVKYNDDEVKPAAIIDRIEDVGYEVAGGSH